MLAAGYGFFQSSLWFFPILTQIWCPLMSWDISALQWLTRRNSSIELSIIIITHVWWLSPLVTAAAPIAWLNSLPSPLFTNGAYSIQKDHDFPFAAVAILGSHWHGSNLAFDFARLDLRSRRFGCTCSIFSRWHWRVAGFNRCTHGKVYWNSSRNAVDNGPTRHRNPGFRCVLAGHLGAEAWPWSEWMKVWPNI